jgi:hypothetical protein
MATGWQRLFAVQKGFEPLLLCGPYATVQNLMSVVFSARPYSRFDPETAPGPDWRLVGGFSAATILIHFLTNGRYGYFRDELYFIACGEHLAWGYVDLPPMVALIAQLSRATLGDSLFALRFFPALAAGATVAIAGILAAEFGGGWFGQALAMLATTAAPVYLGLDTILTMNAFEPVFWVLIRLIKDGDPRWWLIFGLVAGLGLENKESMLFFGLAIVVGLGLTPAHKLMLNRWFWLGGLVALLLFMPTLMWQASHNFPMLDELRNVKAGTKNAPVTWIGFLAAQATMLAPLSLPVWAAGFYFFLVSERGRRFRAIAYAYVALCAAFVLLKGKIYYLAPIYPVMFAAGAVALEGVNARGWRPAIRFALPMIILIGGVILAPMAIPVLPLNTFIAYQRALGLKEIRTETRKTTELPQSYADMFGWPEMVTTVARVYWSLPPEERGEAAIFGVNYGEAAAIDFFGPRYGLPKAISGHMSYYLWGPRAYTGKVLIAVGPTEQALGRFFGSVKQVATVGTEYSMPDEHVAVFVCRNPKMSMKQLWPLTKVYE